MRSSPVKGSSKQQKALRANVEAEARAFLDNFHALARELRWEEAIAPAEQALKRVNWLFGEDHADTGACWQSLAWALHQAGRLSDAEECYEKALANRRALAATAGVEPLLQTTRSLVSMLQTQSRDSDILALLWEQLPLIEKHLPPDAPEQAEFHLNIGVLILKLEGDPVEALDWINRALPLWRRLQARDKITIALEALGAAEAMLGNLEAARSAFQDYTDAVAAEHGAGSRELANALVNCAERFKVAGALEDALELFQRGVVVMQTVEGATVEEITNEMERVAVLAYEMGHGEEARNRFLEIARMREHAFGPDSLLLAEAIAGLGAIMFELREPQAIKALGRALDIWNAAPIEQRNEARYWNCVNVVIIGMNRAGSYENALFLATQARDRARERNDADGAAHAVANMAEAHAWLGNKTEAEREFREALDFSFEHDGIGSRSSFDIRCNFARFLAQSGRFSESLAFVDEARRDYARVVRAALAAGAERQRLDVCAAQQFSLDFMLTLAFVAMRGDPAAVDTAYRHVCFGKGRAFEAFSALRARLHHSGNLSHDARRLIALRGLFSAAILGSSAEAAHQTTLLAKQIEELERGIAPFTPMEALEQRLAGITTADLVAALPRDCALVEFVRFNVFDFAHGQWTAGNEGRARYVAFVVGAHSSGSLVAVDLGDANQIHLLTDAFRTAVSEKTDPSREGSALRQRVFDPLREALGPLRRILLSPDGELARLPFAALPDNDGHLVDGWTIGYVATGRDLLRLAAPSDGAATAPMVLADPDFDLRPSLWERLTGKRRQPISSLVRGSLAPFERLGETSQEGKRVGELLGVAPYLGRDAAEGRLRGTRAPRILHIASHGFFVDQEKAAADDADSARQVAMAQLSAMARSGLALAGANRTLAGEPPGEDGDDGIVTALEVADLDLDGTELAVLSACDTGLGDTHSSEGVLGLRRALALAGARTVLMSLWRVPDTATRELMEHFYSALSAGVSRVDAVRDAQRAVRKKRPRVRDWGAFISEGDVGTLTLERS